LRIIVVDNAPFVRQLSATSSGNAIPEVLKGIGVVDHILNDAETALEALASEPYDALVLGPFANAHLHDFVKPAEKSRTAIIVVSTPVPGREAHESRCSMLAAGADDVMTTPINGEELRCRVLACVRRKRFASQHHQGR
jgi:DNA-binding response OmpR family regulator